MLQANPCINIFHKRRRTHTILNVPPSRHIHTQADNSVSQRALCVTLWSPPDRGSSWTETHGCPELTSLGELKGEESLSASKDDQLSSVCECSVMCLCPGKSEQDEQDLKMCSSAVPFVSQQPDERSDDQLHFPH